MQGLALRKPSQLSGGQQQRVALARALVNLPTVLLLDEPLGALDAKLRKAMQLELKKLQSEVGITFIYVTHDQEEALTMSDRIAVMSRGVIEQVGTPDGDLRAPELRLRGELHRRVQCLHGYGTLRCRRRDWLRDRPGLWRSMVPAAGRSLESGQRVGIVLRPEKLSLRSATSLRGRRAREQLPRDDQELGLHWVGHADRREHRRKTTGTSPAAECLAWSGRFVCRGPAGGGVLRRRELLVSSRTRAGALADEDLMGEVVKRS